MMPFIDRTLHILNTIALLVPEENNIKRFVVTGDPLEL